MLLGFISNNFAISAFLTPRFFRMLARYSSKNDGIVSCPSCSSSDIAQRLMSGQTEFLVSIVNYNQYLSMNSIFNLLVFNKTKLRKSQFLYRNSWAHYLM